MSEMGQTEKNSQRAYVFRCSPSNAHPAVLPCRLQTQRPTETARPIAAALLSITAQVPCDGSPTRRRLARRLVITAYRNVRMNVASVFSQCGGR